MKADNTGSMPTPAQQQAEGAGDQLNSTVDPWHLAAHSPSQAAVLDRHNQMSTFPE